MIVKMDSYIYFFFVQNHIFQKSLQFQLFDTIFEFHLFFSLFWVLTQAPALISRILLLFWHSQKKQSPI